MGIDRRASWVCLESEPLVRLSPIPSLSGAQGWPRQPGSGRHSSRRRHPRAVRPGVAEGLRLGWGKFNGIAGDTQFLIQTRGVRKCLLKKGVPKFKATGGSRKKEKKVGSWGTARRGLAGEEVCRVPTENRAAFSAHHPCVTRSSPRDQVQAFWPGVTHFSHSLIQ